LHASHRKFVDAERGDDHFEYSAGTSSTLARARLAVARLPLLRQVLILDHA